MVVRPNVDLDSLCETMLAPSSAVDSLLETAVYGLGNISTCLDLFNLDLLLQSVP
jgi:hypothetical protein